MTDKEIKLELAKRWLEESGYQYSSQELSLYFDKKHTLQEALIESQKDPTKCITVNENGLFCQEDRSGLRINFGDSSCDTTIYVENRPVGYVQECRTFTGVNGRVEIELSFLDGYDDGNADWIESLELAGVKVKRISGFGDVHEIGTDGRVGHTSEKYHWNWNTGSIESPNPILVESNLEEKVDWAFIICTGLAGLATSLVRRVFDPLAVRVENSCYETNDLKDETYTHTQRQDETHTHTEEINEL